jgi:NAD(P) transhydrogenase subunit alpha
MTFGLVASAESSSSMPFLLVGLWELLLAVFVGFELIQKVPPTLHTPLMSGSNAISGITIVGSLLSLAADYPLTGKILGAIAITLAMINVVGGFLVTNRMLAMFRGRAEEKR